jgi:transcription elongation factor Elf1
MKTMTELEHCPFCGYIDHIVEIDRKEPMGAFATVTCNICGVVVAGAGVLVGDDSNEVLIASAAKMWNTRHESRDDDGE